MARPTVPLPRPSAWAVPAGLLAGHAMDRVLGDPRRGHPVALFGSAMVALERRVWRDDVAAGAGYWAAGVALAVVPVAVAGGRARGGGRGTATRAAGRVPALDGGRERRGGAATAALVAATTWAALGGRSLAATGDALGALVAAGDLAGARALAPSLVGRDPATLDGAGLARAGVESVAENTADAVVGPLVLGALAGAPGVALYRAVNTMDAMVGHRSDRYERFGRISARADDALGWPGARLTALLAVALAPTVGGRVGAAWRVLRRDGAAHPSPNAGRVEAAFAGALGVGLGGRNVYGTRVEERPAQGDGPPPDAEALRRAGALSRRIGTAATLLAAGVAFAVRRPRSRAAR